jgi:hypothetical protein
LIRENALILGFGRHPFSQRARLPQKKTLLDGPADHLIGGNALFSREFVHGLPNVDMSISSRVLRFF